MKFKYLIIVFSIITVFIVLVTILVPLFIARPAANILQGNDSLGTSSFFAANFRLIIMPLLLVMVLLLGCMGIFFFFNYRLLLLLEREDWPALAYYLEQKIYVKGKYKNRFVRLLASSYLVVSDFASVLKLENKAMLAKSSVIDKNILVFGAARVLSGNHAEAIVFFKTYLEKRNGKTSEKDVWVHWYYGFSLLLAGNFDNARLEFISTINTSRDAVAVGLSAFFLHNSIAKKCDSPDECRADAERGRLRVVNTLKNAQKWNKEVAKLGGEIHIAVIKKYIDDAGVWLFS
ncbi:MAG: hypothetical protein LBC80_00270 [Treponema sp.]|nr:hypothetical protein [Treponema sp.]